MRKSKHPNGTGVDGYKTVGRKQGVPRTNSGITLQTKNKYRWLFFWSRAMDSKILLRHPCGLSFEIDSHAILNDVKGEWRVLVAKGEGIISTSIGRDTFWLIATWLMDHQIPVYLHSSLEAIQYFVTELERFPHIVDIPS